MSANCYTKITSSPPTPYTQYSSWDVSLPNGTTLWFCKRYLLTSTDDLLRQSLSQTSNAPAHYDPQAVQSKGGEEVEGGVVTTALLQVTCLHRESGRPLSPLSHSSDKPLL